MSMFKRESRQPPPTPRPQAAYSTNLVVRPMAAPEPPPPEVPEPPVYTAPSFSEPAAPSLRRDDAAVVDRNTRIKGTLQSSGSVLIEGSFDGEMEARDTILIEREASVKGHTQANDLVVSGTFDGEVLCQNRFHVTPTGSVTGEINTRVLVVEEGSTVNCRFIMARERR